MPHIRPISELKNHFTTIADICRNNNEPVYLTQKGRGEFVLMSLAGYEDLLARAKTVEGIDADLEMIWVQEAEQRYSAIESGQMSYRSLEDAVIEVRGRLT
jgi:prevent-host-death family protein